MKALSIRQPYASLIAIEAKKFETRSWKTSYRGILAIHASARVDKAGIQIPVARTRLLGEKLNPDELPTGCIIAKCYLRSCISVEDFGLTCMEEFALGDYSPGRYVWVLDCVEPIDPIPAKGRLGIWEWKG